MDGVDWTGWPLLQVRAGDAGPEQARTVVAQALGEAVRRGEPFAAVVEMPQGAVARRSRIRGAVEHVRMLKALRPGLTAHCRGLAFVMSADAQRDNARAIGAGAKVWGCPTTVTDDPAGARAWARAQLSTDSPAAS